jgi:hypothetical protein
MWRVRPQLLWLYPAAVAALGATAEVKRRGGATLLPGYLALLSVAVLVTQMYATRAAQGDNRGMPPVVVRLMAAALTVVPWLRSASREELE